MHNSVKYHKNKVLIVGAGASGMMAAAVCALNGADVLVMEHKERPGIKLSMTGNGRCNYTNTDVSSRHYVCRDTAFVDKVLEGFGYKECTWFFKSAGIIPDIRHYSYDDFGYAYPLRMNAAGFCSSLYEFSVKAGAQYSFSVSDEAVTDTVLNTLEKRDGSAVIIAAGSNAYPSTGSDSSIYPVFKKLGIRFNTFLPALCPLYSKSEVLSGLKGKRIREWAGLVIDGERDPLLRCFGEIQFNEHSISGIPVMNLSGRAAAALREKRKVVLEAGRYSFEIYRAAGFDRAQVCSGGVDISEIDPCTMQSLRFPGLFFCGEIIDVYGECGGFNLHFAWASGYKAGRSAAGAC